MKTLSILLAAGLAWSGCAVAQTVVPDQSDRLDRLDRLDRFDRSNRPDGTGNSDRSNGLEKPGPTMKSPVDPDAAKAPGSSMSGPSNSGVIVVPPKTGTEEMVTRPKNVDPGITEGSREIDRQNLEKSEEKAESGKTGGGRTY